MRASGFFVADRDLEDELIRAAGADAVMNVVDAEGDAGAFQVFSRQAEYSSMVIEDQLRAFIGKRRRKARYSPLLVDACAPGREPQPLIDLLAHA
jgi:hypothetical protein